MSRDDDLCLLEMLHLRDVDRLTNKEVGSRFGISKGAVIGKLSRINKATDAIACRCQRKENRDGGMPPRWWAA